MTTLLIILAVLLSSILWLIHPFLLLLYRQSVSPLRHLPSPDLPSSSGWFKRFFMGHLPLLHDAENTGILNTWASQFPNGTFVYKGFVGGCRLMTTDPVAVGYILKNGYAYPKPDFVRDSLATMAAGHEGLLTSEGEMHKKQRKIINPAFSTPHLKSLSPTFFTKACELRDMLLGMTTTSTSPQIDALNQLSRLTLDIIGLTGFGYTFNSLQETESELATAFSQIFSTARNFRVMTILQVWFPFLRRFRRHSKEMKEAQNVMRRIGTQLIQQRTAEFSAEKHHAKPGDDWESRLAGRDLLSVLVRSNLESQAGSGMSINEILCQISTFLAAGHETTASALTWTLHALSMDPVVQSKLRASLPPVPSSATGSDWDSWLEEVLHNCPYLHATILESLRLNAPVSSTMREFTGASADIIPTSTGTGEGIRINRHDIISIPISAINTSQSVWGPDAMQFNPERHLGPAADKHRHVPSLLPPTLSFLNSHSTPASGNRSCIGYKFALFEMKIILAVLVPAIIFSEAVEGGLPVVIEKRINVVTRPYVRGDEGRNRCPLGIRSAVGQVPEAL